MNAVNTLKKRYTTKKYDPTKKISAEDFESIKALLQMSPSSTNIQPWHFVIAKTEEGKKRFAKATQDFFIFNESKVLSASHVVAFCAKTDIDEAHKIKVLNQEDKDGRYKDEDAKNGYNNVRTLFSDIHRYDLKDLPHWIEKQVYLNLGSFLLGVASLGIDATPIEGFDMKKFDEEFDLRAQGYTSICLVALGYRADDDFNAQLPKSRLPQEEIISEF